MLLSRSRAALCAGIGLCAWAGAAAAQQAPITYAGQGAAPATQTASIGALAGGGEQSYGYGGSAPRERGDVVIDLRRTGQGGNAAAPQPTPPGADAAQDQDWLERERVGPPYQANGQWYVPTPEPGYTQTGVASWYGPQFHGQRTASGEIFDQDALTAAHPTLPIPSLVQVTNLENGREIIVRVNDRGPFVDGRLIDLSRASADLLGFVDQGQARVHVRYLGPAPRRVTADGGVTAPSSAPVSPPSASQSAAVTQDGPVSLRPDGGVYADLGEDDLAGAPIAGAAPSVPSPSSTPAGAGEYFVQVGAFSDPANAQRARQAAQAAGPVLVDTRRAADGRELFRVRVGPFHSQSDADAARRELAAMGYAEAVLAAR